MASQTKKRPKKSSGKKSQREQAPAEAEDDDLDGLDVDDLDDLDIEDEVDVDDLDDESEPDDLDDEESSDDESDDDLDLDDEDEDDESDEDEDEEDENGDDLDDLDRDGLKAIVKEENLDVGASESGKVKKSQDEDDLRTAIREARGTDEDEEDDEDEDDDLDLDEDDDTESKSTSKAKAPVKEKPAAKSNAKTATDGGRPMTEAQQRMLKEAKRLKAGAKVENVGQQRTADALKGRGFLKAGKESQGVKRMLLTKKGTAELASLNSGGSTASKPAASKSTSAKKSSGNGNGRLPKGMYGVAHIAKAVKVDGKPVHEETVRRVLRLNEDRYSTVDGRWQFTKEDAKDVIREVRSYIRYTGGKRGRPSGSTTQLPDGKVGPAHIAEAAGVHRNTVYKFLQSKPDKFARFKDEEAGTYVFTEAQADKVAAAMRKRRKG